MRSGADAADGRRSGFAGIATKSTRSRPKHPQCAPGQPLHVRSFGLRDKNRTRRRRSKTLPPELNEPRKKNAKHTKHTKKRQNQAMRSRSEPSNNPFVAHRICLVLDFFRVFRGLFPLTR